MPSPNGFKSHLRAHGVDGPGGGREILRGYRMGHELHAVIQIRCVEMPRAVSHPRFWMGFDNDMCRGVVRSCLRQHLLKGLCVRSAFFNGCIAPRLINHQDKARVWAGRIVWHTAVFCKLMFGDPCQSRCTSCEKLWGIQRMGLEEIFQSADAA